MANIKSKREISLQKKIRWETPKMIKLGKIKNTAEGVEPTCYGTGNDFSIEV